MDIKLLATYKVLDVCIMALNVVRTNQLHKSIFARQVASEEQKEEEKLVYGYEVKTDQLFREQIVHKTTFTFKELAALQGSNSFKQLIDFSRFSKQEIIGPFKKFFSKVVEPAINFHILQALQHEKVPMKVTINKEETANEGEAIGTRFFVYADPITDFEHQYNETHLPFAEKLFDRVVTMLATYEDSPVPLDFTVMSISFFYVKGFRQTYGDTEEARSKFETDYVSLDTPTKWNCVLISALLAIRFARYMDLPNKKLKAAIKEKEMLWQLLWSSSQRIHMARDYKKWNPSLMETVRRKLDLDDLARVVAYESSSITVMGPFGEIINEQITEGAPMAYVLAEMGHMKPLIPTEWIIQTYGAEALLKLQSTVQKEEEAIVQEMIPRSFSLRANRNLKIASYDFETVTLFERPTVYRSGYHYYRGNQLVKREFDGDSQNLKLFFDDIAANIEELDGYIFYAHCGGRFDLNLLIRDVLGHDSRVRILEPTELGGTWLKFPIQISKMVNGYPKFFSIEFRDSYRIFLSPLKDVTKDLCKKAVKTHLDHEIINILADKVAAHNCLTGYPREGLFNRYPFPNERDQITYDKFMKDAQAYHSIDCESLLEALYAFNNIMIDAFQCDITNSLTISGLAKKIFYAKYYDEKKTPIFSLSAAHEKFVRGTFRGGMCQVPFLGHSGPEDGFKFYFDFTSHYPDRGCHPVPYGPPHEISYDIPVTVEEAWSKMKSRGYSGGFFRCLVLGTEEMLAAKNCRHPLISVTTDNGLVYPFIVKETLLDLPWPIIIRAHRCGYSIKILNGLEFKIGFVLKEAFMSLFALKDKASKAG